MPRKKVRPDEPQPRSDADKASPLTGEIDEFLVALRVESGLAANTIAAYRRDLSGFAAWLTARGAQAWSVVRPADIVAFLGERRAAGRAESSVARQLSAIRMLLQHLVAEGQLSRDPAALIRAPVLRRTLPTTLTVGEVEALLAAPDQDEGEDAWRAQRDRAFLEVLYASGARVSEATGLLTDGLEPQLRVIRLHGKGDKTRIVPLGARARQALNAWIDGARERLPGARLRREVFLTARGQPLDRRGAWALVKRAAARAGIRQRVSPHTLRHSFATHMIEGGADLRGVQEMLGHASIRTTEIYTHLDAEHVLSLHRLYHPRSGR